MQSIQCLSDSLTSRYLGRKVMLTVLLPPEYSQTEARLPLLLVHDGQDFPALTFSEILEESFREQRVKPLMVVGVHANKDRLSEYGTAHTPDYAGRGNKAALHAQFVLEELLPYLEEKYGATREAKDRVVAGFSLGGLMALDLAWNHSRIFSKVGVFSGALWWRKKAFDKDYLDSYRIMHQQIRQTESRPSLKFWFQTGTNDETDDRDGDGVIDSIDDTLDCIAELERKGYRWGKEVEYVEVAGGEHNPKTWGKVMPQFLIWAFGR